MLGRVRQSATTRTASSESSCRASPCISYLYNRHARRPAGCRDRAQGRAGGVSEIVLDKLIETLLRIAVEHAGADRGLLILFQGDEPQTAAEATTGRGQINVMLRQSSVSPAEIPESVLQYVIRTRESVLLDDALAQNPSRQTSTSATSTPSRCFACLW
jgi:hypothetical protein